MTTAAQPLNDDPALAISRQLLDAIDEHARLCPVWDARQQALRKASPEAQVEAERAFRAADRAVNRLNRRVLSYLQAIAALRACSLEGATAKLVAVLRHGEIETEHEEFPWPQIRSVRLDLERFMAEAGR